jgi:oxygen-independent coproporphyrinogen-3 oxidase
MDIVRLDQRLPRYTSYPTAPHFSEAIGPREVAEALGRLAPSLPQEKKRKRRLQNR